MPILSFKNFFLCIPFLKSIEFLTILLLFYVSDFWQQGMWNPRSINRDQTLAPALKGEVLTPGPPGKSLEAPFFFCLGSGPHPLFPIICPSSADKGTDHVVGHVMDQPCQQIPSLALTYKPAGETLQPGPTWPLQCSCSQTTFSDESVEVQSLRSFALIQESVDWD